MAFIDLNFVDEKTSQLISELISKSKLSDLKILGIINEPNSDYPRIVGMLNNRKVIVRFLDDLCKAHTERLQLLRNMLTKWHSYSDTTFLQLNLDSEHPFYIRDFFNLTLEDNPKVNIHDVVKLLLSYSRLGLIHGHLKPSNIGLKDGKMYLLDPCVAIIFPWKESKYLAPEKILSPQADSYSMGALLSEFRDLPSDLSTFCVLALNPDPTKRPNPSVLENHQVSEVIIKKSKRTSRDYSSFIILGGIILLLSILFFKFQDIKNVQKPEFTQAELISGLESKNVQFIKSIAEYIIESGDKNYFFLIINLLKRIKSETFLNPEVKQILTSLPLDDLNQTDVKALVTATFFEFVSPTTVQNLSFKNLSLFGVLSMKALRVKLPDNLPFPKASDPKLNNLITILRQINQLSPNAPIVELWAKLTFNLCSEDGLSSYFSPNLFREALLFLRVYFENFEIPTSCQSSLVELISRAPFFNQWFDRNTVVDWKNFNTEEKLKLLLGSLSNNLDLTFYLDLIKFPLQDVSTKSYEIVESRCPNAECKKSFVVLLRFKETLTREQLVTLGSLLLQQEIEGNFVATWFSLNPPLNFVIELIIARDKLVSEDAITLYGLSYLLASDPPLTLEQKIKICTHKDPAIRKYGISKLDVNKPDDFSLLERLSQIEAIDENKELIKRKLQLVSKRLAKN